MLSQDGWSWSLGILRILCILIVVIAQSDYLLRRRSQLFQLITGTLLVTLLTCFNRDIIIIFYVFFEARALIVFLFILGFGYQPERTTARIFLLLFTVASSLPLFALLLIFWREIGISCFGTAWLASRWSGPSSIFRIALTIGFIVKFPLYFFHIWLPKAHVEASSGGSIILAGVLLKLGRYGLVRVSPLITIRTLTNFTSYFALLGGAIVRCLCIRLVDLKVLVAYSSVAHISLVIARILSQTSVGTVGALSMSVAHGLASSGLFFGVGVIFRVSGSRLFFFNRGVIVWAPWFVIFWFVLAAFNIGVPPTFNFWAEIFIILGTLSIFPGAWGPLRICLFLAVVFRIIMFLNSYTQKPAFEYRHSCKMPAHTLLILSSHFLLLIYALALITLIFK